MRIREGLLLCSLLAATRPAAGATPAPAQRPVELVWHVETEDGELVGSHRGDESINPASVVKVATTLRALERLGPDHRFETRFAIRGKLNSATGLLDGDLIVLGGGDPDFHLENAFMVAEDLNRLGLKRVGGMLLVDAAFWIGWEGGPSRHNGEPRLRAERMASRLREAFDPARWTRQTRQVWSEYRLRRGSTSATAPVVTITRGVGMHVGAPADDILVTHSSNTLARTLRRFNVYSNNDIERLEASIGTPALLAVQLVERWEAPTGAVRLETLSGLGSNRMSPRQIVRLLQELAATCEGLGVPLEAILPVAGCGYSTLSHLPGLRKGGATGALVAKTGTLTQTDGGVSVLAGVVHTAGGRMFFCVAAPGAGRSIYLARQAEARWVLDLLARHGGARRVECPGPVSLPGDDARTAEMSRSRDTSASPQGTRTDATGG